MRKTISMKTPHQRAVSDNSESGVREGGFDGQIKEDIRSLVNVFIEAEKTNKDGFRSINPSFLLDNSHILTKGRLYEGVMDGLLQDSGETNRADTAILERVDAFLTGFINSERKSRSKLKLNYIMSGASSNRLESAISMLSETEQVDDDLLMYIDALTRRKMMASGGKATTTAVMNSPLDEEGLPNPSGSMDARPSMTSEDTEDGVDVDDVSDGDFVGLGEGNDAVAVLQMIRRRLVAEVRTTGKPELRLLAALLAEPDVGKHAGMLRAALVKVEQMERFETFLENGIVHLSSEEAELATDSSEGSAERERERVGPFDENADSGGLVGRKKGGEKRVAPDTVEKMRDVLLTLKDVMRMFAGNNQNMDVFEVKSDNPYAGEEEEEEEEEEVGGE
jgi:hypothetical protein